jgi:predicted PurR-regulated permease PerM
MPGEAEAESRAPVRSPAETVLLAERAAVLILLAVLLYAVVRVLEPFGLAIAFGGFIAIGTWPAREALQDLSPTPPPWLTSLPLVGEQAGAFWRRLRAMQGNISALIAPYGGQIARLLVDVGQAAAGSVMQVLLALVVAAMFWTGEDRLAAELRDIARRLGGAVGVAAVDAAGGGAVRGVAWGVVGTGILQAVLMGLGLAIAGVPGEAVLAFLTMIFSISQVLGPLVVVTWGAAAAWLYGQGEGGWALLCGAPRGLCSSRAATTSTVRSSSSAAVRCRSA